MRIVITGATGFVGRRLVERLRGRGHVLSAWVRSPAAAAKTLGPEVALIDASGGLPAMAAAIAEADAIINLAGEPVIGRRWTDGQRQVLRDSRVGVTALIVDAIAAAPRPRVLVSASAVGYYGDTGAHEVDEQSPPGSDFLAELCVEWEAAALRAERSQTRVCLVRIGLVLGRDGGALGSMLTPFRLGLGGPMGSGKQYFPWVHLDDLVGLLMAALERDELHGPLLAVAPGIVTNREFGAALGHVLHRPAVLKVPAFALRLALGDSASALLAGQRATPRRTVALGFSFQFPELAPALHDLLG
jgi:uncharacterized protein (TIGR01777 family)